MSVSIKDQEEQEVRIRLYSAITGLVNKLLEVTVIFAAGLEEERQRQKGRGTR
jgi:hypothetical protein